MTTPIYDSDVKILRYIADRDEGADWYKLGRKFMAAFNDPSLVTVSRLIESGFVEERAVEGEVTARFFVTSLGIDYLSRNKSKLDPKLT